jgi:hypothetical protein
MKKIILFTLSCALVLVDGAKANVSEMVLSGCSSKGFSENYKYVASSKYNSIVEIDNNTSLSFNLINLNSEYAESKDVKKIMSNEKYIGDQTTVIKMFYATKVVEIKYFYKGKRYNIYLGRTEDIDEMTSQFIYNCSSKSISK